MKAGDIVRIKTGSGYLDKAQDTTCIWPEAKGQIGVIIGLSRRLYIPAAKIMILGEIAEFDLDEMELVNESR